MSFSRLLRFFSDHLSITSPNSSAPEKEESSSNSSAPKKEESSSNSSAPKIMASTSTSSIAVLGVMLMASSTFIYYFYSKASSSNSSEPKKEESSSNSSEQESSSNSAEPEKEESSSNSSEPEKEESSHNSSEPEKEESSHNSSAPKKEESSNSAEPKKEESSSNSSEPEKEESSHNSSEPEKEESSHNSSAPKKEESSNSAEPKKEESSHNSSEPEKEESSSNSSEPKVMVSTPTSCIQTSFKYDVFLSFRGADIRTNFLGHLYEALKKKGIATFKDDVGICKGNTIFDELIKAIEDSRFYIIVFSKNYASSSWCLDELVKIMKCRKMTGHTAYPVFYDVEPTQVRKQSGAVENAFSENKEKDASGKWEGALKEAAGLSGWVLKDGDQSELIKKIVGFISLMLRSISFGPDKMLVGMETRVTDVVESLEMGIDDVRMIGIKSMGGAGKTTTARAVFDRLSADFEAKTFVANVREVSKPSMSGLKKLQEKVLSKLLDEDVTLDSVTDGKKMMQERMRSIKVLLVLDDVNHSNQLEALAGVSNWFKPGSRIIVTTRNEQVLVAHRVKWIPDYDLLSREQVLEAHRVNVIRDISLLSDEEAIFLLSRHAFGSAIPPEEFKELSGKVAHYAAGLPLALEVLGSSLCGKNKHEWEDFMKRLAKFTLPEEIQKKLELSYESLEKDYKEMFLDIACILKGLRREDVIRILECRGFNPGIGLRVLEQRCLITFSSKYEYLGMHDHIEEMGKNIVRRDHPDSRLWIKEKIEDILVDDEGTEATICLELRKTNTNAGIIMKGLGKMNKLRYLKVYFPYQDYYERDAEDLDNTAQYFSKYLEYLNCTNYPFLYLPKTFQVNNLVGLEIKRCRRMERLWEEGVKKVLENLKFLSLSESALTTFDFSMTPSLERLSLEDSPNLVELFMPVSCQKLNYLHISKSKLRTFDLGLTPNLEKLSLNDCADFEELHMSSACPNLKFLELRKSRLSRLNLELFPNLERLGLEGCDKLVEINAPVGCLRKLVYLNLTSCLRFSYFVVPVGELEPKDSRSSASLRLVGEILDSCPLHPNSNLPKLRFRCYYDEDLPSSVGNIEKLISFGLCACTDFKKFSDMICSLRCLRKLELECDIPDFPKDLGQLECLEELCLSSTKIKHLPNSIRKLKCLKSLEVDNGDLLEKLPKGLGQLECLERLHVRSKKIKHLPKSICMLKRLKSLDVRDCSCLGKLPKDIGQLESLESLDLSATKIKHLPDSICMLKCLKSLEVDNGDLLEKLPGGLGQLECLERLHVKSKKIKHLPKSICMLKRLKSLDVRECSCLENLPKDIGQLESLVTLDLSATKIKHLPDSICTLKHLTYLNLDECALLENLPEDLGRLECFKDLYIAASPKLLLRLYSSEMQNTTCHRRGTSSDEGLKAAEYFLKLIDMGVMENKSGNWPDLKCCEIRNGLEGEWETLTSSSLS
ncbi:disease resistance protein (TIR-NBS-LRR class) family [Artemisia annua]|uniref:Disease resistance protein (TIR-NBS-LRR class) family n=1 Tax=Artemisia annua TaxID=35608 RepID=A0A2U1N7E8_ARTAN|nr:disease resistance protein (TIR-NBS-LRR class) family [Artemisia annua]